MPTTVAAVLALSFAAAICGIIWWIFRPANPEKRWHVFFATLRMNGVYVPLYMVGENVGTRSIPNAPIVKDGDWVLVTVTGYPDRETAHAAASRQCQMHHDDTVKIQRASKWPGDYKPTPWSLDPGIEQ